MKHLAIKDMRFVRYINDMLRDRDVFKITRDQLYWAIMAGNSRNKFWGLQNCLDGILEDTGISYKFDITNYTVVFRRD